MTIRKKMTLGFTAFLLALAVPAVTLMFSAAGSGSATVDPKF